MATIGTFTKNENGVGFTGAVKTLTLNVKAKFTATEGDSERGPDFRIFAGATEFGAAWKKIARETQREYLSVKRQPGRSRGRKVPQPHLVPPQRRLRPAPETAPLNRAGLLFAHGRHRSRNKEIGIHGFPVFRLGVSRSDILLRPPPCSGRAGCLGALPPGAAQGRPGGIPSLPRGYVLPHLRHDFDPLVQAG